MKYIEPEIKVNDLRGLSKAALVLIIKNSERHMVNMANSYFGSSWHGDPATQAAHQHMASAFKEAARCVQALVNKETPL